MLVRAEKEGFRDCMACAFEIEGLYFMPERGKAKIVKELLKDNIVGKPTIKDHWYKMFDEVVTIATNMLNEQYNSKLTRNVSVPTNSPL